MQRAPPQITRLDQIDRDACGVDHKVMITNDPSRILCVRTKAGAVIDIARPKSNKAVN